MHSIAGGLDYGRLHIVAHDKETGAAVAIAFDTPSDMEVLMTATHRQYQVITKLVVRQHGARSQLHGHAIFFEQHAESHGDGVPEAFTEALLAVALNDVRVFVVGTQPGKYSKLERRAQRLIDKRVRPDVLFNLHQMAVHVPDPAHRDRARPQDALTWEGL